MAYSVPIPMGESFAMEVLFNMGLVQMKQVTEWKIAVSKEGAIYLAELKMQIIKSVCSVLLAAVSAVFGFVLGLAQ